MPYAINDKISQGFIENGIEITDAQYVQARDHSKTGLVKVHAGNLILTIEPETRDGHKRPVWDDETGDWRHEPLPEPVDEITDPE